MWKTFKGWETKKRNSFHFPCFHQIMNTKWQDRILKWLRFCCMMTTVVCHEWIRGSPRKSHKSSETPKYPKNNTFFSFLRNEFQHSSSEQHVLLLFLLHEETDSFACHPEHSSLLADSLTCCHDYWKQYCTKGFWGSVIIESVKIVRELDSEMVYWIIAPSI